MPGCSLPGVESLESFLNPDEEICVCCLSGTFLLLLSAGNTMTVSYMTGLMIGSTVAYAAYSFTAPAAAAAAAGGLHKLNATRY